MLFFILILIILIIIGIYWFKKHQEEKFIDCPCCLPPEFENECL